MLRRLGVVFMAAATLVMGPAQVLAQATPEGEVLGAAACTVEPVDFEALLRQAAAGTPDPNSPVADGLGAATATPPVGEPADEETVRGVEAAVRQFFACLNAGDYFRLAAVFTPESALALAGAMPAEGVATDEIPAIVATTEAALAEAGPSPDEDLAGFVEVRDVVVLGDGRVAATVVGDGVDDEPTAVLFTFRAVDGVFLIENFAQLAGAATPSA